jgi:hypothetical protein
VARVCLPSNKSEAEVKNQKAEGRKQ